MELDTFKSRIRIVSITDKQDGCVSDTSPLKQNKNV